MTRRERTYLTLGKVFRKELARHPLMKQLQAYETGVIKGFGQPSGMALLLLLLSEACCQLKSPKP